MAEDKFKRLIQNIDLDEPADSFTDDIMKMVGVEEKLKLNPALLSVLKNELLANPSIAFSDRVMGDIRPKVNSVSQPIITRKAGLIVLSAVSAMLLFLLINSHSLPHLRKSSYFPRLSLNLAGISSVINTLAASTLSYLIPISILSFLDYFLRTRQRRLTSDKQGHY